MDKLENCCIDVLRVLETKDRESGFPISTIIAHYFRLIYTEKSEVVYQSLKQRSWITGEINTARITPAGKEALAVAYTDEYLIDRIMNQYFEYDSWQLIDEILAHMQVKLDDRRKRSIAAEIAESGLLTPNKDNLMTGFRINNKGVRVLSKFDKYSDYKKHSQESKTPHILTSDDILKVFQERKSCLSETELIQHFRTGQVRLVLDNLRNLNVLRFDATKNCYKLAGGDELPISEAEMDAIKQTIIPQAKAYIKKQHHIDLTAFIQNDMAINEAHAHSAFIRAVAHQIYSSGGYQMREENGRYYLWNEPRKPIRERYWWLWAIIAYLGGLATDIAKTEYTRSQLPDTKQSQQPISTSADTTGKRKIYLFPDTSSNRLKSTDSTETPVNE